MRIRKVLSLALAMCLLMTLLPLQSFASADARPDQQSPQYANLRDSGHYPKIQIQKVTEEPAEAPKYSDSLWQSTKTYAVTYLTVDKAAEKLREYLVARQTNFDIYVKSTDISEYNAMVDALLMQAAAHTGNPVEGDYLLWQVHQWGGQVDDDTDGRSTFFHFTVEMSYYTTADQETQMNTAVNALLQSLDLDGKSDYEKVKAVYNYVCQNVTYDETHPNDGTYLPMYTAYGALIGKTAVSQGYALLLYRLLLELRIDCRVIPGQLLTGTEHTWNIVKLGSVYYNLDATMDATVEPDMFFLRAWVMDATHYRYLDYMTLQFHQNYPMSENDYVDGVEGVPTRFFVRGQCGENAYWGIDWEGTLTIGGTGATYDYKDIRYGQADAAPWFYWQDAYDALIVEEGITKLGNNLFAVFLKPNLEIEMNLASITLPESLEEIGDYVFLNCDKLTQVRIPDGVKIIGNSAFADCSNLQSVILGNSVETIDFGAFALCKALPDIHFPDSLKTIKGDGFRDCDSLTEITIPAGVESVNGFYGCVNLQTVYFYGSKIENNAFSHCPKLQTVVLSDNLTEIGIGAFDRCQSLREITIPKNVKQIWILAFKGAGLQKIIFAGDAPQIGETAFARCVVTAEYPAGNSTWTEDVLQNYGGTITWVPVCADHRYEMVPTPATCTESGGDVYTCPTCGDSYVENAIPALGHKWSEGSCENPRTCTVCGESSGHDGHIYDDGVDGTCNACGIDRVDTVERTVVHMFRMYNPNTGEHFYTGSEVEKNNLIVAGWQYEGVGFTFPANTGLPVHRLFQPSTGEHLYTMDEAEKDRLMAEGWNYEGIAFNSAYDTEAVQHRLHNPNAKVGAYHFTFSIEERDTLIAAGWEYQGIGWYSCWK